MTDTCQAKFGSEFWQGIRWKCSLNSARPEGLGPVALSTASRMLLDTEQRTLPQDIQDSQGTRISVSRQDSSLGFARPSLGQD